MIKLLCFFVFLAEMYDRVLPRGTGPNCRLPAFLKGGKEKQMNGG